MSDSIGARLRQARELRHLTFEQASETTKLRTHYLQALEADDYSAIPSAAQARGFLRLYAEFLGLDAEQLLPAPAPEPAPVAPSASAPGKPPSSSAQSGWLAVLLKRFSRSGKSDAKVAASDSAPLVPESVQAASAPASSEAETARRPKQDSAEVKKNALRK